jgi:hypothetical protein
MPGVVNAWGKTKEGKGIENDNEGVILIYGSQSSLSDKDIFEHTSENRKIKDHR